MSEEGTELNVGVLVERSWGGFYVSHMSVVGSSGNCSSGAPLAEPSQQTPRVQVRVTVEHLKCLVAADGSGLHHVESLLK